MIFPRLVVIEALMASFNSEVSLDNIKLISVQHLVDTTGSLFEYLIKLGFVPQNIYLKGKVYSTNGVVEDKLKDFGINIYPSALPPKYGVLRELHKKEINMMWEDVAAKLTEGNIVIILDDGGLTIRLTPETIRNKYSVFAIEQTTYGLRFQTEQITFPIVQVATSAAKTMLEPLMISRALNRKLQTVLKEMKPKTVGVVGYGHVGKGVAGFLSKTYKVAVYDNNPQVKVPSGAKMVQSNSMEDLVQQSDVVIGATGVDVSNIDWEKNVKGNKLILSVSSHDTEFNTLIRTHNIQDKPVKNVLRDFQINYPTGGSLLVFRGGSVANFDNTRESCKKNEIQLTRGLLFAGILQIIKMLQSSNKRIGHYKLCPHYQMLAVDAWFKNSPHYKNFYPQELLSNFRNKQWIEEHS